MYERAPASQVYADNCVVVEVRRARGIRAVCVRAGRRLDGRLLTFGGMSQSGWTACSLELMLEALRASLGVNMARFGDAIFVQNGGLPIGGPLSDLGAGLLLGLQEATWRQMSPLRMQADFPQLTAPDSCERLVTHARYVDDIVSVSTVFCLDCLTQLVQTSHPEIPFSREADSATEPVKWLDAVIHGRYLPPHVSTAKPELSWLCGHVDEPAAFRVRPYLDEATVDHTVLRAHVRSRLARWGEMQLSRRELVAAMTYDLLVLLRSGYPPRLATTVWARHAAGHRDGDVARLVGRHLLRQLE